MCQISSHKRKGNERGIYGLGEHVLQFIISTSFDVNEYLNSSHSELNNRLNDINMEFKDFQTRLSKLYDALETDSLSIDGLAPKASALTN